MTTSVTIIGAGLGGLMLAPVILESLFGGEIPEALVGLFARHE